MTDHARFKEILNKSFVSHQHCMCFQLYCKNIDKIKSHHGFITSNIYSFGLRDNCIEQCDNELHQKSAELLDELLTDFFVNPVNCIKLDRSIFFNNGIIAKKSEIFKPTGFFSMIDNSTYPNFNVSHNYSHCNNIKLHDLISDYSEVTIGFVKNKYDQYTNCARTKNLDNTGNLIFNVIDEFNRYDFDPDTFGDFITDIFNMCSEELICKNDRIVMYFEFLDHSAGIVSYFIEVPVDSADFSYNTKKNILVTIGTGFYGI